MGTNGKPDLGAVVIYIISPTRALLVKDPSFRDALWKLPGGGIEPDDADIIAAAIRESREETGIQLLPKEVELRSEQRRTNGAYYPYFCVARVSERKLNARFKIANENGRPIMTGIFERMEVPTMRDMLERHRFFIREIEGSSDES